MKFRLYNFYAMDLNDIYVFVKKIKCFEQRHFCLFWSHLILDIFKSFLPSEKGIFCNWHSTIMTFLSAFRQYFSFYKNSRWREFRRKFNVIIAFNIEFLSRSASVLNSWILSTNAYEIDMHNCCLCYHL